MRPAICQMLLALTLAVPASARSSDVLYEVSVNKLLMGTTVETTARHADILQCRKAVYLAYREMERIEDRFSSFKQESEISGINRAAGVHPVKVSSETFALIQRAKADAERLDGLVDVSIGPLTELWGISSDSPVTAVPKQEAIDARRKLVGYRNILLDSLNATVFLPVAGSGLDLGGVAKAYAVDRAASLLKREGVNRFIIKAGGDIYVSGRKDDQTDWRVGVQHPREKTRLIARFNLKDSAVSTSGDYERYVIIDGQRYHHIMDPRTGYPATLSRSATVLAPTPEEADALAKYLFVLGYEKGLANGELAAVPFFIVASDGSVHYSQAFSRISGLEFLDKSRTEGSDE